MPLFKFFYLDLLAKDYNDNIYTRANVRVYEE